MPPACTTAKVSVPKVGLGNVSVSEGATPVWQDGSVVGEVDGIAGGEDTDDAVTFDVGSGVYVFRLTGREEMACPEPH